METKIEKQIIDEFTRRLNLSPLDIKLFLFLVETNLDPNSTHAVFGRRWDINSETALSTMQKLTAYFEVVKGTNNDAEWFPKPTSLGMEYIKQIRYKRDELKDNEISDEIKKASHRANKKANLIAIIGLILFAFQLGLSTWANLIESDKKEETYQTQKCIRLSLKQYKTTCHSLDCSCGCKK